MAAAYKVYEDAKLACFLVRWKEGDSWRTKRIPAKHRERFDAEKWAEQWWSGKEETPGFSPTVRHTLVSLCERWESLLKEQGKERHAKDASTLRRRYLEPSSLARIPLEKLTLGACVSWVEALKRTGLADYSVRNLCQRACNLLTEARGRGWTDSPNHFDDKFLRKLIANPQRRCGEEIIRLSAEDARLIVEGAGRVPEHRHVKNLLALATGLRAGEIAGLSFAHLSLDDEIPHLNVERQVNTEGAFAPPKKNSKRLVPIHPVAVEALKEWRRAGWTRRVGRSPKADDPVFPTRSGRYVYTHNARFFREDLASYGCSPTCKGFPQTFHSLRRTCASLLNEAKVPDAVYKQIIGHKPVGVTRRSYVDREQLAVLNDAILKLPFDLPKEEEPKPTAKGAKVIDLASRQRKPA